jgi:glycosyltransferase involved in cell wall biosynthesis
MLGWEFPPHISGGLGTACFGLTRGLDHHGVEVLFVVPRARGDEDERFVDVLGANTVSFRETVREKRRVRTEKVVEDRTEVVEPVHARVAWEEIVERVRDVERTVLVPREEAVDAPLARALEILSIDSLLTPYLTERDYLVRLAERPAPTTRSVLAPETRVEPLVDRVALRREAVRVVGELRKVLVTPRTTYEETEEELERIVTRPPLDFSGAYGPDLHAEVARYALAVAEIARNHQFDVVHAHDWMAVPAGLAAKKVSGKPLVLHVHACEYDRSGESPNEVVRDIEQLGFDGADRVICVSHYTCAVLQKRYRLDPEKVRVVHNAVTHEEQRERIKVEKTIDEPIVLFLGRVTFQKGPDYFLEAAARVARVLPKVKFVMSGSGDMLPAMVERAARLGLSRHVHFTGFLKGEEVERMYALADIYVMPSVSEPFGISPLEAMALDVPVIVSRQSGVSEVLRNALKVDFWDVEDLANKIVALLKYPALSDQLSAEGLEEVRRIRWETPAKLVKDVYAELAR